MRKYVISAVIFVAFATITFLQAGAVNNQKPATAAENADQQSVPKTKTSADMEEALKKFLNADKGNFFNHFITKHGELKKVDEHGKFGQDTQVTLNDVVILKAQKTNDGRQQELFLDPYKFPVQYSPGDNVGPPVKIDRILLSEGCGLNYVTQFILLDFTCDKPFVSERFGFNPGLKWHIHLGQVKWGKEKSYIDLDPKEQGRYVYYTCDRIEDITDDEDAKESAQRKKKTQQKQKPANKTHR